MREELLNILPGPVKAILTKEVKDHDGRRKPILDLVLEDATAYGFQAEEIVPCLHAAYYGVESTCDADEMAPNMFWVSCRAAMKLLSYGKYHAERAENGWMIYKNS